MSSFRTVEQSEEIYENDGLKFLTVKSDNLKGRGDICVYVPKSAKELHDLPIYILLHGVYGNSWAWALKGAAHKTAEELINEQKIQPAIIAMPSDGLWGDGSAYISHRNRNFDKWITEDVPTAIKENIKGAGENSSLCIGGLSMGGYGALSLGSKYPQKFKAISGHSSITKLEQMKHFVEEPIDIYLSNCNTPNVIETLLINKSQLPSIRFDCGKDDPLLDANRKLHLQLNDANIDHRYEEFPGGHEWPYWQKHVSKTLEFFDDNT